MIIKYMKNHEYIFNNLNNIIIVLAYVCLFYVLYFYLYLFFIK